MTEYVLPEFVEHYEKAKPHEGLGQRTPRQPAPIRASETGPGTDRLGACLTSTPRGGLIRITAHHFLNGTPLCCAIVLYSLLALVRLSLRVLILRGRPNARLRAEVVDHMRIFGRRHLEYVLPEFVEHYDEARPHQALGQRTGTDRSLGDRIGTAPGSFGRRFSLVT